MNFKTVCLVISLVALALFTFGIGEKWELSLLGVGLFCFVASFVSISKTS